MADFGTVNLFDIDDFFYPVTLGGSIAVGPASISSSSSFGTALVENVVIGVEPDSISSTNSFGTALVETDIVVLPDGIDNSNLFGDLSVEIDIIAVEPGGIDSTASLGSPTVISDQSLTPDSIESVNSFGDADVSVDVLTFYPGSVTLSIELGLSSADPVNFITTADNVSQFILQASGYISVETVDPGADQIGGVTAFNALQTMNIRALSNKTLLMSDPQLLNGHPRKYLVHSDNNIVVTLAEADVGPTFLPDVDTPLGATLVDDGLATLPSAPPVSPTRYYRWSVNDLSAPSPTGDLISTWPETSGYGPDLLSKGVHRPLLADYNRFLANNEYRVYTKAMHFRHATANEYMWTDLGFAFSPVTIIVAGVFHADIFRGNTEVIDLGLEQVESAGASVVDDGSSSERGNITIAGDIDGKIKALSTNNNYVGRHYIHTNKPQILFATFNGSESNTGFMTGGERVFSQAGSQQPITEFKDIVIGRRKGRMDRLISDPFKLFDLSIYDHALSLDQIQERGKYLASIYRFGKY